MPTAMKTAEAAADSVEVYRIRDELAHSYNPANAPGATRCCTSKRRNGAGSRSAGTHRTRAAARHPSRCAQALACERLVAQALACERTPVSPPRLPGHAAPAILTPDS